ncbi:Hpt domain-containing protein [Anaerorhabdus sp.]|jgi:hypothetical protein|uniref:Hpt domain-containing protein n=1 Tax=Anaerorhabdus sp. TaxID=1872524 RepID=UPI002FC952FF
MDVIQYLNEIGCDTNNALERVNKDKTFYVSCLIDLIQDQNFNQLIDAVNQGNLEQAFFRAHTLKGILANLGITPFYQEIVPLVELLRESNMKDAKIPCNLFIVKYEKFINDLKFKVSY